MNDIVMQWHGVPGKWKPTYPNLEISIGGDKWLVRESFGPARVLTRKKTLLNHPEVVGKWTFWALHAKWSPTADEILKSRKTIGWSLSERPQRLRRHGG